MIIKASDGYQKKIKVAWKAQCQPSRGVQYAIGFYCKLVDVTFVIFIGTVDIHLNFIGTFDVPADIVTPMELEEQRRYEEEQAAKKKQSQEFYQARYERRKQEAREFTERMKAGLLTPEELEE